MNKRLILTTALALGVGMSAFAAQEATLKHRYSFEPPYGDGYTATDSVGGAHGALHGDAYLAEYFDDETWEAIGGMAVLSGQGESTSLDQGSFISLPPDLISTFSSFSIETWVQATADKGNWMRIYDFGSCNTVIDEVSGAERIESGNNYTMLTWRSNEGTLRSGVRLDGVEHMVNAPVLPIGDNVFHHIVYTYDNESKTGKIYCDGVLKGSGTQEFNPTQFGGSPNMWLGKAQWADPYFAGNYAEFRIYEGVLSAAQVLANNQVGPNDLTELGELVEVGIVAPRQEIYVNERLPIVVEAVYSIAGTLDVSTEATLTSSNEEILLPQSVSGKVVARGLAPGEATLTVEYLGKSAQIAVVVTDALPEVRLDHRYSFNGNVNDSVGTAHGELMNGATISGGMLVLAPASSSVADSQYAKLPGGLMADYMSTTVEVWAQSDNVDQAYNYSRYWEFSNSAGGEGIFDGATQAFFLTPRGPTLLSSRLWTPFGDTTITGVGSAAGIEEGKMTHLVVVVDGVRKTYTIYKNGELLIQNAIDTAPMDMGWTANNLIGRSSWADPGLVGKIDEMRIYSGAMSLEDIRLSLASGPNTLPSEKGELQALHIVPEGGKTTIVESAALSFNVYADYQNVKNVLLDLDDVSVQSDNDNIVGVDKERGKLLGNSFGSAILTATMEGVSGTIKITVTPLPTALLTHRYSFDDETITDSIAGANGTLIAPATVENGYLVIPGAGYTSQTDDSPHVQLPANLISDHESITMETWVKLNTINTWARIWDFGNKSGNAGTKYMFLAPYNGTVGATSANFVTTGQGGAEQCVYGPGYTMPTGKEVHIVVTLLADANLGRIYVDGIKVAEVEDISNNPVQIGPMAHCYLGRAMYAADPILNGSINEFRTWKNTLTAKQVAINCVVGPDTIFDGDLGEFLGLRVVSVAPYATPGATVQFHVYADYENLQSLPFNSAEGVQISIDNPAFTLLNSNTYTCNVAASGNLIVEFEGETYTTPIAMGETPAQVIHRYSFTNGVNDSIGTAHGENWGLTVEGGQLVMTGSAPIQLPAGLMSGVEGKAFSIETWMDIDPTTAGNWSSFNITFFDPEDAGPNLYNNFAIGLQPNKGGQSRNNTSWALVETYLPGTTTTYKTETFATKGFPGSGPTHLVWVIDPESQNMKVYINGRYENQVAMTLTPEQMAALLEKHVCWLGCSRNYVGLPGKMDEFRLWKGAMTTAQIAASFAAGPDTLVNAGGYPQGILLDVPLQMIAGTTTPVNVYLDYQDIAGVPAIDSASVFLSSSDENILSIDNRKRLVGVAPGFVKVTALYEGGVSTTFEIEVLPEQIGLLHRYSFDEGVSDSVGVAHGFLNGPGASVQGGELVLDGSVQHAFAQLPAGLVSGLKSMSWEVWFTPGTYIANWNRLLDFGQAGASGNGTGYLFASIYTGAANVRIATRAIGAGEEYFSVAIPDNMQNLTGQKMHMVYTYAEDGTVTGYLNGQPVSVSGSNSRKLSDIPDYRNYIGRSMYLGDPPINFSMDEFRIWNGVLGAKEVAANYAAGPDEIPTGEDRVDGVIVNVAVAELLLGEGLDATVIAHYTQAGNVDITAEAELVSSDENVIAIDGTRVVAVGSGSALVSCTFEAITGSVEILVGEDSYLLAHRYSFLEDMSDSVGGADGTLFGTAVINEGILTLDGTGDSGSLTDGSFAALPANIISGFPSFSVEAWARATADKGNWTRLYDFGSCFINGEGRIGSGNNYSMVSWKSGNNSALRSGVRLNGVEDAFNGPVMPIGDGVFQHVVYTYNSGTQTGKLYVNGVEVGSSAQRFNPTQFGEMPNMWLGKANWPDPYFAGEYEEFRIYRGTVSPLQVLANFEAGPEEIGELDILESITLSAPQTEILREGGLAVKVIAHYAILGEVDVTETATLTSADTQIVEVLAPGTLKGAGAGTTVVTASFEGKDTNLTITVLPQTFILSHRYSFDDGAKDSIGGAHGTVYGEETRGTTVADGILHLSGQGDTGSMQDGSFVALPGGIMNTFASYTIETWARANEGNAGWGRVFDFGSCALNGEGRISSGTEYTMLAWGNGIHSVKYQGAETQVKTAFPAAGTGTFHHVVYTYSSATGTGSIYIDGILAASGNQKGNPTTFTGGMPNMWIGKSNWPDPYFTGDFEEFRIYNGILLADQVEANFTAGPDAPPIPDQGPVLEFSYVGGALTLSWEGGTLQACDSAVGVWTDVNALSPYPVETSGAAQFFRIKK